MPQRPLVVEDTIEATVSRYDGSAGRDVSRKERVKRSAREKATTTEDQTALESSQEEVQNS